MNKFTVNLDDSISTAVEKILINGQRTVIVLNKNKAVGIISEGDILKSIIYKKTFNASLSSIMNKNFKYLKFKSYTPIQIEKIFLKNLCHIIPVVDKNLKLKKIITLEEHLKSMFKKTRHNAK